MAYISCTLLVYNILDRVFFFHEQVSGNLILFFFFLFAKGNINLMHANAHR